MPPKRSRELQSAVQPLPVESKRSVPFDFLSLRLPIILNYMRQERMMKERMLQEHMHQERIQHSALNFSEKNQPANSGDPEESLYYDAKPLIGPLSDVQIRVFDGSFSTMPCSSKSDVSRPVLVRATIYQKAQVVEQLPRIPPPIYPQPIGPQTFLRTTVPEEAHPYALAMLKELARE